jgi:hypothetical protein
MSIAFTRHVVAPVAPPPVLESVSWRVFQLLHLGGRRMVAEGDRPYEPRRDVVVKPVWGSPVDARTLSLPLSHGFALSVTVSKTPLEGFGLFISRPADANGFSWEWFDRDRGLLFEKRRGRGRVRVDVRRGRGYEELAAVEFVEEIALRYLDDIRKPLGTFSHEVIIGRGSVFNFAVD